MRPGILMLILASLMFLAMAVLAAAMAIRAGNRCGRLRRTLVGLISVLLIAVMWTIVFGEEVIIRDEYGYFVSCGSGPIGLLDPRLVAFEQLPWTCIGNAWVEFLVFVGLTIGVLFAERRLLYGKVPKRFRQ